MNNHVYLVAAKQIVTVDPVLSSQDNPLGLIENAVMAFDQEKILWVGKEEKFPNTLYSQANWILDPAVTRGKVILPGLIDSHTHPIFAGNRCQDFEMRLEGKTYQEIAAAGGGITNTVNATRSADKKTLSALAYTRLERMMGFGVTTVEAKSGYGLDRESEIKSLEVIRQLQEKLPLQIIPTYMGAHDIPTEYKGRTQDYVEHLCQNEIPHIASLGLATFCDIFCEEGYFNLDQTRQILECAKANGFKLKVHAEEFCELGGASLAANMGAASADHLLHIGQSGIDALKASQTVATLLPGTAFYLNVPYAPARKLLDAGVTVALATDFNPGSCMSENLQLVMTLACLQMRMTPVEVIKAVTINAAKALDLAGDRGSLSLGKRPDWVLFDTDQYQDLLYHFGVNLVEQVAIGGHLIHPDPEPMLLEFF